MMKWIITVFFLTCVYNAGGQSVSVWPLPAYGKNQQVKFYKPTIESIDGAQLGFRAAISVTDQDNKTPLFGSVWGTFTVRTNTSANTAKVIHTEIDDIRFPEGITTEEKNQLTELITAELAKSSPVLSVSDISKDLDDANKERELASQMDNTPPKIIYAKEASILVFIDGAPVVQETSTKGVDKVMNTPFLILKYQNVFYLSNGQVWYRSSSATGNYIPEKNIPSIVKTTADSMKSSDDSAIADAQGDFYPKVIVSTEPAELIQTEGDANFSAIQGTSLLYVSNSEEQLLMDINSQMYYVLLSGRWYAASRLDGVWSYIPTDRLPADFARIPEGSEKDIVLASVPGTMAAKEAVRDAQVPKVAMVERNNAKSEVMYDGDPDFEQIEGTNMRVSVNSSNPVIQESSRYYLVDDGIWFVSSSPNGPWVVSEHRPSQVNAIPPSSPVYHVKYVYIYAATPEVVYVGYTPGYLCNYVHRHTIVYGTGWRYRPWHRRYYFPRPYTWGFGMCYNPWYGWSLGLCYGVGGYGWFGYRYPYYRYGWWGPPVFRPPYRPPYTHYYGPRPARPRPPQYGNRITTRPVSTSRPGNIYNNRMSSGVRVTRDRPVASSRPSSSRENYNYSEMARPSRPSTVSPSTRPGTPSTRPSTPSIRPNTPSTRPGSSSERPNSSSTRPGSSSTRPGTPSTRPNTPSIRPGSSSERPNSPSTQPNTPSTRPSGSSSRPGSSSTRPSTPSTRPTSPSTQPGSSSFRSGSSNSNRQNSGQSNSRQDSDQPARRRAN